MSRGTHPDVYAETILNGIRNANKSYIKWTGGEWLHTAPEYLITVEIARALGESEPVSMEVSTMATLKEGAAKGAGKNHRVLEGLKRFDLVVKEKSGLQLPRAVIEVKHPVYGWAGKLDRDIARLATAIRTAKRQREKENTRRVSLSHAYLAFYTASDAPERIDENTEKRISRWVENVTKKIAHIGITATAYTRLIRKEGDCEAYAVAISLKA